MNKSYGLLEKLLWEDSIGCAVGCRILARRFNTADPEEAFLAGLFRHLGKIVMNYSDPDSYRSLAEAAYEEGLSTSELEGRFFSLMLTLLSVLLFWINGTSIVRWLCPLYIMKI